MPNIDADALQMYSAKRPEMIGHVPSESSVATHNDGAESKRWPYFTVKELRVLNNNMRRYLKHSEQLFNARGRNGIDPISQKTFNSDGLENRRLVVLMSPR